VQLEKKFLTKPIRFEGIHRIEELEYPVPAPLFIERSVGIVVELNRSLPKSSEKGGENAEETLGKKRGDKRGDKLTENCQKILNTMKDDPTVSHSQLVEIIGIGPTNIEKNIKYLKEHGWTARVGITKSGHWEVVDE